MFKRPNVRNRGVAVYLISHDLDNFATVNELLCTFMQSNVIYIIGRTS